MIIFNALKLLQELSELESHISQMEKLRERDETSEDNLKDIIRGTNT